MKKMIICLLVLNLSIFVTMGGLYLLSENHPFRPGDPLFGTQLRAENLRALLARDAAQRASLRLRLVERSLADLANTRDSRYLQLAVDTLDSSLSQYTQNAPSEYSWNTGAANLDLATVLAKSETVLAALETQATAVDLQTLEEHVLKLRGEIVLAGQESPRPAWPEPPQLVMGRMVPFLTKDITHKEFPLMEGHANLDCMNCHADGIYQDTSSECRSCHATDLGLAIPGVSVPTLSSLTYPLHFAGECVDCHNLRSWQPVAFGHADVWECKSCHAGDLPKRTPTGEKDFTELVWREVRTFAQDQLNHYPGDCLLCHPDTMDWEIVQYNHANDCAACHLGASLVNFRSLWQGCTRDRRCNNCHEYIQHEEPYPGPCEQCHVDEKDWLKIQVSHDGYDDCLACHSDETPKNHFPGNCQECHNEHDWDQIAYDHLETIQCVVCHVTPSGHSTKSCQGCHTTESWQADVLLHTVGDCANCHAAPRQHYSWACSRCHTTQTWQVTGLNHINLNTCEKCHTSVLPDNHYPGECGSCHTASSWKDVQVDHNELVVCAECHVARPLHFTGECQSCHTTSGWYDLYFDHTGYTNCELCHPTQLVHYPGLCTECHVTSSWLQISYGHKPGDVCTDCHPSLTGHWPGECSKCHNTNSWDQVVFDHTGYTDCKACHNRPSDHPRGQCSNCHTTENWVPIPPTPTKTPSPTPESSETPGPTPTVQPSSTSTLTPIIIGTETIEPSPTPMATTTLQTSATVEEIPSFMTSDTPHPSATIEATLTPVPTFAPVKSPSTVP